MKRIIVGITGASGAMLAERFVRFLLEAGHEAHVVISSSGEAVLEEEMGIRRGTFKAHYKKSKKLYLAKADDFAARISSGSAPMDAMVVIPCSMSTVGSIAHGVTMNLIHRAAGVSIKEKRPLVLVPRESPFSPIHLKNLLELSQIGVHIVPATTAFYHKPKTVEEMVDFTIGRVLDLLKIEHKLFARWRDTSHAE
ncbi:MAG: UbiX family flavin prenyltransferase [Candidatus Omnitrophica bacterium]|nr:UbiX family flavin prenyltransferase [Candidatus Omnitrophota bacterium]